MLLYKETGMKMSLFPAGLRVIFCQSTGIFTKWILLFKINDIGVKANTQQFEFSQKLGDAVC